MGADWAVIPSTESTGRSTIESGLAADPSGISTTGNCQIVFSKPLSSESRRTMASARRSRSSRSAVSELLLDTKICHRATFREPRPLRD